MASKPRCIPIYQAFSSGTPANPPLDPDIDGGENSFVVLPWRGTIKRAADGTALSATPPVGAVGPVSAVVRNGAGDYTVTLVDDGQTAAQVAAKLTCHTAGLVGSVVVTDATHLAVATKTDAGVATDSIFSLDISYLDLP